VSRVEHSFCGTPLECAGWVGFSVRSCRGGPGDVQSAFRFEAGVQLLEAVPQVGVQLDLRPGGWCFSLVSLTWAAYRSPVCSGIWCATAVSRDCT
jgi:hypothetical protein